MTHAQLDPAARALRRLAAIALALAGTAGAARAQYFGQNKVQYERFDFDVLRTAHFDVHHYPVEAPAVRDAARMLERWNARLTTLFNHPLSARKPIILYADQPDFQQTNVISGQLDEGTGGVTESLLDRLVMPLTGSYAETDHVAGHEMVHVFQYDLAAKLAEKERGASLDRLPLYLVEGMAEYLSIGPRDAHTAMWLRDAVRRNDLPTIKQLTNGNKYFPYRYGEALWAYVGGTWGDDMVPRLFRVSLRSGFDDATRRVLGMTTDSLSKRWHAAVRAAYAPLLAGRVAPDSAGDRRPLGEGKRGEYAVSPALSPDGRSVAYVASRSVEGFRLVVADVETGRVRRTLATPGVRSHFDALGFLYSAGTWSPDGRRLAVVTYAKGDNEIILVNVASGDVERRIKPRDAGSITTLAWSPDGRRIAFSGTTGGPSDLGVFDLGTGETRWLTRDRYADLHPAWSPDGATLAFVTDREGTGREGTDLERLRYAPLRLALADVATGAVRVLPGGLPDAAHVNPQFSADGASLFFVSDAGGFRDVYRLALATGATYRVTRVATGVSGVTATSPAISVARGSGRLAFSVFDNGGFRLVTLDSAHTGGVPVERPVERPVAAPTAATPSAGAPTAAPFGGAPTTLLARPVAPAAPAPNVATPAAGAPAPAAPTPAAEPAPALPDAAHLPADAGTGSPLVARYLDDADGGLPADSTLPARPYRTAFRLAGIGPPSLGGSFGGALGTQVFGSASALFTDVLGDHTLGVGLMASGKARDLGGQLLYLNTRHRWNWGASVERTPYLYGYGSLTGTGVNYLIAHLAVTGASAITQFPFSSTRRVEMSAGYSHYGYYLESVTQSFTGRTTDRTTLPAPSPIGLTNASIAYVGDDASFGFTSPASGTRFRFELSPTVGTLDFQTALVDVRRYVRIGQATFAVRGLHYGRYGRDADSDRLGIMYLGDGSLVRGYSYTSFASSECSASGTGTLAGSTCPQFDRLIGSRLAVANVELRIPVLGVEGYGLVASSFPPLELAPFVDVGAAWTGSSAPSWTLSTTSADRTPVASAGVAARLNLFGYAVLQAYWARPFQRPTKGGVFGFVLQPGW
jgi:Tol biopolymer transport system component